MSNYYVFKVGDLPLVKLLTNINVDEVNPGTLVKRAVTDGRIKPEDLEWEVIGRVVKSRFGNSIVFVA